MKGVATELHRDIASASTSRQKHPVALFNLTTYQPPASILGCQKKTVSTCSDLNQAKDITFQMNYEELCHFYSKLEEIQHKIDTIK